MSDDKLNEHAQEVLPIIAEELTVGKREIETGKVRVSTPVYERKVQVDEPVFQDEVDVVRVPVNVFVDTELAVRQEGDTTIVPVVEERLVLVRRLFLKEEVHITKRRVENRFVDEVTLRFQEAEVQHVKASS